MSTTSRLAKLKRKSSTPTNKKNRKIILYWADDDEFSKEIIRILMKVDDLR
jgi:hypothetical protein